MRESSEARCTLKCVPTLNASSSPESIIAYTFALLTLSSEATSATVNTISPETRTTGAPRGFVCVETVEAEADRVPREERET